MAAVRGRSENLKTERIYQKVVNKVENGNYYEASQIAKSLFFRYKVQGKYNEAVKLSHSCSLLLLKHKQVENGLDLAREMIKCYNEGKIKVSDDSIDRVIELFNHCDKDTASRHDFVKEALSWSKAENKYGNTKIHQAVAAKYWQEGNYASARENFVHCYEGEKYARFLIEYHVTAGYPGEIDLFVTQAVLQILCLQKIPVANILFFTYTMKHPGIKRRDKPYKQPLLNFIAFLLLAIEFGSLQQFTLLCEQYHPSIARDPIYFEYLDKIGQLFFGMPPKEKKKDGLMGMIDDIMQSMVGDGDLPDECEEMVEEEID